jgi:hypothetical protein
MITGGSSVQSVTRSMLQRERLQKRKIKEAGTIKSDGREHRLICESIFTR